MEMTKVSDTENIMRACELEPYVSRKATSFRPSEIKDMIWPRLSEATHAWAYKQVNEQMVSKASKQASDTQATPKSLEKSHIFS
jgi:hypothetical protein